MEMDNEVINLIYRKSSVLSATDPKKVFLSFIQEFFIHKSLKNTLSFAIENPHEIDRISQEHLGKKMRTGWLL